MIPDDDDGDDFPLWAFAAGAIFIGGMVGMLALFAIDRLIVFLRSAFG